MSYHRSWVRVVVFSLALAVIGPASARDCCVEIRGNIDGDPAEIVNIVDLSYLVIYLFDAGPAPPCFEEADLNADSAVNIADLSYLVTYLFDGGPLPLDCPLVVPDTVIVPLAVGNQWMYHVVEYNESGAVIDEYDAGSYVTGDTVINDSTWYIMQDSAGTMGGIWTNMDDGLWSHMPDSTPPELLTLKYPALAGESYPVYQLTVHVDAVSTSVTVPAGTFECYYYRLTAPIIGTVGKIWAAPNVGVVKAEQYDIYLIFTYLAARVEMLSFDVGD